MELVQDDGVIKALLEVYTVDRISVAQQVARHLSPRKCFNDLLGRPLGGWSVCDVAMKGSPPIVR